MDFDPNRKLMESAEVKDFSDLPESSYLVSIKYDGIRAYVALSPEGKPTVYSRTHKPIPNLQIQLTYGIKQLLGCEGELTLKPDVCSFSEVQSVVMSEDKQSTLLQFNLFPFSAMPFPVGVPTSVKFLVERVVETKDVQRFWDGYTGGGLGPEGLMFRSLTTRNRSNSGTKAGRSTVKEGYLIKWKAKKSAEFKLKDIRRLFNKDGVAQDCLGSLVLQTSDGKEFKVGTGFTLQQRVDIWYDLYTKSHLGQFPEDQLVEVEFMDYYASGIPRQPVFKVFRDA
jgi:ATP-dependent DNA ligase